MHWMLGVFKMKHLHFQHNVEAYFILEPLITASNVSSICYYIFSPIFKELKLCTTR